MLGLGLGLRLGLKADVFGLGLGLVARDLGLGFGMLGLGHVPCSLVKAPFIATQLNHSTQLNSTSS